MSRSTRSPCRPPCRNRILLAGILCLAPLATRAQTPQKSCLDVQVGSARSFDCINEGLREKVGGTRPPGDDTVVTATSPSNRTGTFNQSATREYLGSSFGHSAVPQPHLHTTGPQVAPPIHP